MMEAHTVATGHLERASGRSAPTQKFSLAIGLVSGTVVVTIRGEVDRSGARHLEEILKDLIENQEDLRVVVDLHHVARLDPSGVAALLVATDHAVQRGGRFAVNERCRSADESREGSGMAEIIPLPSRHPAGQPATWGSPERHPSHDPGS